MYQLAQALQSVHSKKVCHRDIKPQNIILDIGYECQLIDFGISKTLKKEDFDKMLTGVKGTFQYLAPELMKKKAKDIAYIDLFKSDMWALGLVLYQCVHYCLPFTNSSKKEYKAEVCDQTKQIELSSNFYDDIISKLLERDPQ